MAQRVRPPSSILVVLFNPPGMIVNPPSRLDAVLETPMARKVTLGFDFRLNGSILSMAAIVASDSVPSMRVRVIMMSKRDHIILVWKGVNEMGKYDAMFKHIEGYMNEPFLLEPQDPRGQAG